MPAGMPAAGTRARSHASAGVGRGGARAGGQTPTWMGRVNRPAAGLLRGATPLRNRAAIEGELLCTGIEIKPRGGRVTGSHNGFREPADLWMVVAGQGGLLPPGSS